MVFRRREELPDVLPPAKKKDEPTVISRRDETKDEPKAPAIPTYDVQSIQAPEPPPWLEQANMAVERVAWGLGLPQALQYWNQPITPREQQDWGWQDYYSQGGMYQPSLDTPSLEGRDTGPVNVWVGQGGLGGDLSKQALADASRQTALAMFGAAYGGLERYGIATDALIPTQISQEVVNNMAQFFTPQADAGIAMWEESFGKVPEDVEEGMIMVGYFQEEDGDWSRFDPPAALDSYLGGGGGGGGRGYGYGYGYPNYGRAGGYAGSGLVNWRIG